jgi:ABC-type transport system substrate-binding protein
MSEIFGVVAGDWTMSEDGKTMSFTVRQRKESASGNDLTAEDEVFPPCRDLAFT